MGMIDRLVQKHFLYGTQELEIRDDSLRVRISRPLGAKKELSFVLAMLDPEPVVKNGRLLFHSRVKCGPMISLYLDKPDPESFNAFVDALKARARKEYSAFLGPKESSA